MVPLEPVFERLGEKLLQGHSFVDGCTFSPAEKRIRQFESGFHDNPYSQIGGGDASFML